MSNENENIIKAIVILLLVVVFISIYSLGFSNNIKVDKEALGYNNYIINNICK